MTILDSSLVRGAGSDRLAGARQDSDRRFRHPGDAADRAPRARGGRLLRDRAVPEGGRGLHGDEAEGRDPLRRAGIGARRGRAARAAGDLRRRRAGARHLLRPADHGARSSAARSRAGTTASSAAPMSRSPRTTPLFEGVWRKGERYPVWMSHGDRVTKLPAGLPRGRHLAERAVRHDRGREAQVLRHPVPPRGGAHARRRQAAPQLRAQDRRLHRRLDHARLPRGGDREDPRAGRQGQGDLRPLRRRRFRGRRGADPRGDRRPAHLRVRRSRPAAARRGREGRRRCSAITTTSRWSTSMREDCSSARSPASPTPRRSARPSAGCSSTCSRRKRRRSAAPSSWRRARSIPT